MCGFGGGDGFGGTDVTVVVELERGLIGGTYDAGAGLKATYKPVIAAITPAMPVRTPGMLLQKPPLSPAIWNLLDQNDFNTISKHTQSESYKLGRSCPLERLSAT